MKKEKKEKTPSKFKLWKAKMKSTPKGKAYLKLIYWAIFFVILLIYNIIYIYIPIRIIPPRYMYSKN